VRIVLIGGGLSHILFIRDFAQKLPSMAEVILVHTEPHVFYQPSFTSVLSRAMPVHDGFVDLRNLCTLMGVTFIQAEVEGVHLKDKIVRLKQRASIQYDHLSLAGLEVPDRLDAPLNNHAVVHGNDYAAFFAKLKEIYEVLRKTRPHEFRLGIVGGGAAGVAIAQYCRDLLKPLTHKLCIEIFEKEDKLLPRFPASIRRTVEKDLKASDILFHTEFDVQSVKSLHIQEEKGERRSFTADAIVLCNGFQMPEWLATAGFIGSEKGFLETHKTGVLLSVPNVSADGWVVGASDDVDRAKAYCSSLFARAFPDAKTTPLPMPKPNKKQTSFSTSKELWTVRWGILRKSEKLQAEKIQLMKASLEHLRAVKEQRRIQLDPSMEDAVLVENLKKRLALDIDANTISQLFSEFIGEGCQVNAWIEKEYKDVFNDHYQSSYYATIDALEKSFLKQSTPEYLRLHVAAPVHMKDVEILSQIIVGVVRAAKNIVPIRLHICSQSMNAVQMTLGVMSSEKSKYKPEKRAYIAVARPLGLYGLLSQQANSESIGQWISSAREQLSQAYGSLLGMSERFKEKFSSFPVSEFGLMNDLTSFVGHDGWRVCVNLSQLPRWEGVDHIMKQHPNDVLIERNWRKGFKFWPGHDEVLPESQYLLWEPHVLRPTACFIIDPDIAHELDREFLQHHGIQLHFVGYVEAVHAREQTHYKLSDWQLDATNEEAFIGVTL
jgi:NADH dehydrogenase FAD-containing subunit